MDSTQEPLPKEKIASSPFDGNARPPADVILRTSDNVRFFVHRVALSLASSFFEGMFTIPQPAGPDASVVLPVIDIAEDSATLDCLLRYIYPVRDPQPSGWELLDNVWAAAKKYELTEAADLVAARLHNLAASYPLELFAIACRHHDEALASLAADKVKWRTVNGSCNLFTSHKSKVFAQQWHASWLAEKFDGTLISQCCSFIMKGRVTAGAFYRLLQYVKDGDTSHFLKGANSATFTYPSKPNAAASWAVLGGEPDALGYLSRQVDPDIILESRDGVGYRVHRALLEVHLDRPLESALQASPIAQEEGTLPVFRMQEDTKALGLFLSLCYPSRPGEAIADWNIDKLVDGIALRAYHAAERYGFTSIVHAYRVRLRQLLPQHPLRIYCTSAALGFWDEASAAARELAFHNVREMYCPELESLSVEDYFRLLRYHHSCHVAIRSAWNKTFPKPPAKAPASQLPASGTIFGFGTPSIQPNNSSTGTGLVLSPVPSSSGTTTLFGATPVVVGCPVSSEVASAATPPEWAEAPWTAPVETAIWKALLERELAQASSRCPYALDWKDVAEAHAKAKKAIDAALDALRL